MTDNRRLGYAPLMCGCGHLVRDHSPAGCQQRWEFPEVRNPRDCSCTGPWQPSPDDSRYERWRRDEYRACEQATP